MEDTAFDIARGLGWAAGFLAPSLPIPLAGLVVGLIVLFGFRVRKEVAIRVALGVFFLLLAWEAFQINAGAAYSANEHDSVGAYLYGALVAILVLDAGAMCVLMKRRLVRILAGVFSVAFFVGGVAFISPYKLFG